MPSLANGANLANKELIYLGVSGDGFRIYRNGQFAHVVHSPEI